MIQAKILATVQKGMQYVPAPVRSAMTTDMALKGCVVVGGALTAYGTGNCSGSQAVAGVVIGAGTIALDKIPLSKLLSGASGIISAGVGRLKRK